MADAPVSAECVSFATVVPNPPQGGAPRRARGPGPCRLRYADGHIGWLVTRHALVKTVLADSRFSVKTPRARVLFGAASRQREFDEALASFGDWRPMENFLGLDPPEHTRYR